MKFLRILFFYTVFFLLAMVVVVTALETWSEGAQMLFAFVTPAFLVWWNENRRARKKTPSDEGKLTTGPVSPSDAPRPQERTEAGTPSQATSKRSSARPAHTPTPEPGKSKKSSKHQAWVPYGESASVRGRDIGGMVYVGTPPSVNTYGFSDKCRAYIDPSLPVARTGDDPDGHGMPYWPGYSDISPRCRATYLGWLAGGKTDAAYNPGYMFLYFYGWNGGFSSKIRPKRKSAK